MIEQERRGVPEHSITWHIRSIENGAFYWVDYEVRQGNVSFVTPMMVGWFMEMMKNMMRMEASGLQYHPSLLGKGVTIENPKGKPYEDNK